MTLRGDLVPGLRQINLSLLRSTLKALATSRLTPASSQLAAALLAQPQASKFSDEMREKSSPSRVWPSSCSRDRVRRSTSGNRQRQAVIQRACDRVSSPRTGYEGERKGCSIRPRLPSARGDPQPAEGLPPCPAARGMIHCSAAAASIQRPRVLRNETAWGKRKLE